MSVASSKRKSTSSKANVTRSFLNTTNPEIFVVKPRPGGYVTVHDPYAKKKCEEEDEEGSDTTAAAGDKKSDKNQMDSLDSMRGKHSRDFRIHKTVYDSTWTLESFTSNESERSIEVPTPLCDAIDMLSVSLTTVMLLAAGVPSIPAPHIQWTNNFFTTIKDEYGHTPPNLQGILNHVGYLQKNGLLGSGDEAKEGASGTKRGSKTVRTTTTVKRKSDAGATEGDAAAEPAADAPAEGGEAQG